MPFSSLIPWLLASIGFLASFVVASWRQGWLEECQIAKGQLQRLKAHHLSSQHGTNSTQDFKKKISAKDIEPAVFSQKMLHLASAWGIKLCRVDLDAPRSNKTDLHKRLKHQGITVILESPDERAVLGFINALAETFGGLWIPKKMVLSLTSLERLTATLNLNWIAWHELPKP